MADFADGLAGFVHFPDDLQDLGEPAQLIGRPAAGDQKSVIIRGLYLIEGIIGGERDPVFTVIGVPCLFTDQIDLASRFTQAQDRIGQLKIFKVFADQGKNLFTNL